MQTIIKLYFFIAFITFAINCFRYIKCAFYHNIYNNNFVNNTPEKNYSIKLSVFYLLKKAEICNIKPLTLDLISNKSYIEEFNYAFESAKGYFRYYMIHSLLWGKFAIEKLSFFAPARLIKNKLASIIFALAEALAVYLLGLYLDTTGIGNKILTFLLDALNQLSEHLAEILH